MRLLVLIVLLQLAACSRRSAEVHPGEADYPLENPAPLQVVQLTVVVPPTFSIASATSDYAASESAGGTIQSGTACAGEVGLAVTAAFHLNRTIPLTREGNAYKGAFAVDQYAPGRCDWGFRTMSVDVVPKSNEGPLARYNGRPDTPADVEMDVWCIKDPGHLSPGPFLEFCSSPSVLAGLTNLIPRDFIDSVPASQRDNFAGYIGRRTRTLVVEYHDINAMANYHEPGRQ